MSAIETLANNLRHYRKEAGLTQEALAEESGFTQSYISHIETCRKNPRVGVLQRLSKPLGVSASALLCETRQDDTSSEVVTISDLIDAVGDDNVDVQFLHESMTGAQLNESGATITFATEKKYVEERALGEPSTVAFVCWIKRDDIPDGLLS